MAHKRFKSQAIANLISKETNVHWINPHTRKIDLKMFTKHLCDKDEYANLELDPLAFDNSSFSDNQFVSAFQSSTDADDVNSSCRCCYSNYESQLEPYRMDGQNDLHPE